VCGLKKAFPNRKAFYYALNWGPGFERGLADKKWTDFLGGSGVKDLLVNPIAKGNNVQEFLHVVFNLNTFF